MPLCVLIASLVIAWFIYAKAKGTIDKWLVGSIRRRQAFRMIFLVAIPTATALVFGMIDLRLLFGGLISPGDIVCLSLIAALVPICATSYALETWHTDVLDRRQREWDLELKLARAETDQQKLLADQARNNRDLLLQLNDAFLRVVSLKAGRVRGAIKSLKNEADCCKRLSLIRNALSPDDQIFQMIVTVHGFYSRRAKAGVVLRVAYFTLQDGYMQIVESYDGLSAECIKTPNTQQFRHHFKIEPPDHKCLVVHVAVTGKLEIITDAEAAHASTDRPFQYFTEAQRNQIKSIVALPLRRMDEMTPLQHVLTIDSNEKGYFSDDHIAELGRLSQNVAHRLLFELEMKNLLEMQT